MNDIHINLSKWYLTNTFVISSKLCIDKKHTYLEQEGNKHFSNARKAEKSARRFQDQADKQKKEIFSYCVQHRSKVCKLYVLLKDINKCLQ